MRSLTLRKRPGRRPASNPFDEPACDLPGTRTTSDRAKFQGSLVPVDNGVTEYELRGTPGRTGFVVVHEVRARRADTAAISPLRPLHPRLEVEHELQQGSASKAGTPACAALLSR
jgi:hypothetical protein